MYIVYITARTQHIITYEANQSRKCSPLTSTPIRTGTRRQGAKDAKKKTGTGPLKSRKKQKPTEQADSIHDGDAWAVIDDSPPSSSASNSRAPSINAPFQCWNCDKPLDGMAYVLTPDDRGYCSQCYADFISPICNRCAKTVDQNKEALQFEGMIYFHEECIKCAGCSTEFTEATFILYDNLIFCVECMFSVYGEKCDACALPLLPGEMAVTYQARSYHEACMVCRVCRHTAVDRDAVINMGRDIYCANCFLNACRTPCGSCGKKIDKEAKVFNNIPYHVTCFRCGRCETNIDGLFKTDQSSPCKLICQWCSEHDDARCVRCRLLIVEPNQRKNKVHVEINEYKWHMGCFKCTHCDMPLVGDDFSREDASLQCKKCYKILHGSDEATPLQEANKIADKKKWEESGNFTKGQNKNIAYSTKNKDVNRINKSNNNGNSAGNDKTAAITMEGKLSLKQKLGKKLKTKRMDDNDEQMTGNAAGQTRKGMLKKQKIAEIDNNAQRDAEHIERNKSDPLGKDGGNVSSDKRNNIRKYNK